ncbi:hypothetical protein JCM3770_003557 [Rhodotorula araucariae]
MRPEQGFQQTRPTLQEPYSADQPFKALLERLLPDDVHRTVAADLERFEHRIAGPIRDLAAVADLLPASVEPTVTQFDQWGQRVDTLHTSEAWRALKAIAAEEGLVSIAIERNEGEFSRIFSFAKAYLFAPEGLYVGCPISMTDGCARVLELAGTPELKDKFLPLLCSRDGSRAYTAGQWMTERPGGSDVSLTETVARPLDPSRDPQPGDAFVLDGFKWFSSATDGDVALALARTGGQGSRGLSLFLVELRDGNGKTNGIYVHRLKKKFGTKALPTAELEIRGAVGRLIGPLGAGVKIISSVLNITRLWSAMSCLAALRRGLDLAKSFAAVRHVGGDLGALLRDNSMHTSALAQSEVVHRAVMHLAFGTMRLLGRSEALPPHEVGGEEKARLRLMTPVVKAFAAELTTSELPRVMEGLGGQGYMVENQFGRLIADANVERIWEGTTSVLALDVVRVVTQTRGAALTHFVAWAHSVLSPAYESLPALASAVRSTLDARLALLVRAAPALVAHRGRGGRDYTLRLARPALFLVGFVASAVHLVAQAEWSAARRRPEADGDAWVVERWVDDGKAVEAERAVARVLDEGDDAARETERRERELVYGLQATAAKL